MGMAAIIAATMASDIDAAVADYPCAMWVNGVRLDAVISDLSMTPYSDVRGMVEDGTIQACGKVSTLKTAGGMRVSDEVQVQRYGETQPRWYIVQGFRMDDVGFDATLVPKSTERTQGMML